ncbi:amino acid ABC transporter permease [Jeotgalibaca caeni]|uniref:amino acid ABC transporter permease n=1 Tax=Jeotgalibaca caeni TaxID=3028623 RepID=UPI00237E14AB|nr:amino acid ABC transporter permease [Jeotgalibaca caeni]MDE1548474.1 amino acid ABC transporter permease [Jeotgalibaca caeni]
MVDVLVNYSDILLEGFINTMIASVIALFLSIVIGTLFGIFQVSQSKVLQQIARIYVQLFLNLPLLVIVLFFYIVFPMYVMSVNGFTAGIIGLTIYTSAFIAETVRAGIQGVPTGQMEAGLSTGFTYWETMRYIVLPQALKIVIPPLGNQFINLVKNSSILAVVAGLDLMYYGDLIASETFNTFDTYIVIALFYLVITLPLTYFMQYLERRLATNR